MVSIVVAFKIRSIGYRFLGLVYFTQCYVLESLIISIDVKSLIFTAV